MTPKLLGIHPTIREIRRTLRVLANCGYDLLLIGERGVGKTLVGRLIHSLGPQRSLVLRALNFALITEREQRIALFGIEPPEGSSEREGYIESPSTLLLRNIENMFPHIQQRLVDALSSREFTRTPAGPIRKVSCRIIFTTSERDLQRPSVSRLILPFRQLLWRLPKFIIPPLRDRVQDIPLIAADYRKHSLGLPDPALPPDDLLRAQDFLRVYPWRENITELKACLRATMPRSHGDVLCERERLEFEKLMFSLDDGDDFNLRQSLDSIGETILKHVLATAAHNQLQASRITGLSIAGVQRSQQRMRT